jgi:hypothetical protein
MTTKKRKIPAREPIVWTSDLNDDCTALWAGLTPRAEWLDEDCWWWAVYDMQAGGKTVDSSNEYDIQFIGGEAARNEAEDVARNYGSSKL